MSADRSTALSRLQAWYHSQCNGEWEHGYGISITTVDNPGWHLEVDLHDLKLAQKEFEKIRENSDHRTDWMICWKEESKFQAGCGPNRLEDVIEIFLKWASQT